MNDERKKNILSKLDMIAKDMKKKAADFDGKPFDATYFGYQGAAIVALAKIIKALVEDEDG